jgi:hypothetical protein
MAGMPARIASLVLLCAVAGAHWQVATAEAASWRAPVNGDVVRSFAWDGRRFAAGRHRGVDLAVAPGAPVRSPCAGPVAFAGTVPRAGGVVSVRCGHWRVSLSGLREVRVRTGAGVRAGSVLAAASGTVAPGPSRSPHVHVGVRREGVRDGYVDPLRFLAAAPGAGPPPAPRSTPPARRIHRGAPPRAPASAPQSPPRGVPWPAWAGVALVAVGTGGGSLVRRRRRARAARVARRGLARPAPPARPGRPSRPQADG